MTLGLGCAAARPYTIRVVDESTGRGVPLVELRTPNEIRYTTDSAGYVAFDEPGFLGRRVFFHVKAHGYEHAQLGKTKYHGVALDTASGGSAVVKVKRLNVAERLYRITGGGIYADSVRLGVPVPLRNPVLDGEVAGQDSALSIVYRGKVRWFWGDTFRVGGPVGHFQTSGATSELPANGGLDPSLGVDLTYFVGPEGFSRPMVPLPEKGLVWTDGLMVIKDPSGTERLVASFARLRDLGDVLERGLVLYDETTDSFKRLGPVNEEAHLAPRGHPVRVGEHYYFGAPGMARVRAEWAAVTDPTAYEGFTPLRPGSKEIERGSDGRPVYGWKRNTPPLTSAQEQKLLKEDERWNLIRDVQTKAVIAVHAGSVAWNEFRRRYVMIFEQIGGKTSYLGEIWFAQAERPEGPWRTARQIVSHEKMSFYNPVHHPFFDQQGGRLIYFQGTYTNMFSGNTDQTPRYEYNQIMYRLDLSDPRLPTN